MKLSVVSFITAFAAIASAFTEPDLTQDPSGNPIGQPGLDEQVPAGEPYTITWEPTTPGKVSIQLLRGPSTNVQPIALIADAIDNTGSFEWNPPTSLEADVTHYGLRLIVEGTGQYQYSTQFGIKNDNKPTEPSPSPSPSPSVTTSCTTSPSETPSETPSGSPSESLSESTSETTSKTTSHTTLTTTISQPGPSVPIGTGVLPPPSGPSPPPTSLSVTPTPTPSAPAPSGPAPFDNAGGRNIASIGGALAAIVAVLAF